MVNPAMTAARERFDILDIIRGIALFGVLLANMQWYSYFGYLTQAEQAKLPLADLNAPLEFLGIVLLDGKFYSLFSVLFGLGFSLIMNKERGGVIVIRRLVVLLCIGITHALLLWEGDILILYALLGLILPCLNRLNDKALLILAACLLFSPILLDGARVATEGGFSPEDPFYSQSKSLLINDYKIDPPTDSNLAKWMKYGDVKDLLACNYVSMYLRWGALFKSNRLPKVLGLFLIGLIIGRRKLFVDLSAQASSLRKIRDYGFLLGVPASIMYAYIELYSKDTSLVVHSAWYIISVFPMAFAYGASICLLFMDSCLSEALKAFTYIGKMALTSYLMQSFIAVLVFNGVGLGLAGEMGFVAIYTFGFILFVFQIVFCRWWLSYYAFGPCEWVWRQLTYGELIPLKLRGD